MITSVTSKQLQPFLINSENSSIDDPYFIIHAPETEENIQVIKSGKNGNEFNKTIGFFNKSPNVVIYRCVYGHGVLMIQKNDEQGEAKEVKVAGLRPGVEVEIPAGYGHVIANTGKSFLIVVDNALNDVKYKETDLIKSKHGLAYYIIDRKGEIAFERNDNYSFHPQITSY